MFTIHAVDSAQEHLLTSMKDRTDFDPSLGQVGEPQVLLEGASHVRWQRQAPNGHNLSTQC